jgi:hypothetical protein
MNILEAEDMIKGLPDQALMQEAQGPSGQVPQYLVVSEIQRRSDMRKRHQEQMPKGTVKDQILGGIGGINTPQPQGGMPPQGMPPQGIPPQGMPPMPPQGGMPPQGIPPQGGMPPQGMPPQGIPPQGIGAMPPPQQMMSGGIIRLSGGGEAPRSRFEQIMEELKLTQQMNMPNYQMLAPATMPRREVPEGLASLAPAEPAEPPNPNSFAERFQGSLDEAAGRRGAIGDFFAGEYAYEPESIKRRREGSQPYGIFDTDANQLPPPPAEFETNIESMLRAEEGTILDPRFDPADAGYTAEKLPEGQSDVPAITQGIAQAVPNDRSLKDMIGDLGVQRQGLTDQTRQGKTSQTAFDLSDLIAESKKDSMNNALMQLGAGIAGGDLSKGISAAGMAAAQGNQRSKDLAIQERLMSYKAGREDLARQSSDDRFERQMAAEESRFTRGLESKDTQFGARMNLMTKQIDAQIEKGERVSKGQLLDMATKLALDAVPDSQFGDTEGARAEAVQNIFRQLMTQYAGFMDVDTSGLPTGGYATAPQTSNNDPLGLLSQ